MKKIIHKIAHLFNWNYGVCDAFSKDGKIYMSFLCTGCGKRSGIHPCDDVIDREIINSPTVVRGIRKENTYGK